MAPYFARLQRRTHNCSLLESDRINPECLQEIAHPLRLILLGSALTCSGAYFLSGDCVASVVLKPFTYSRGPSPLHLRFTPVFTMAPRRASELKHDKIEQYPDTQPMEEDDPIEPTTAPSQSSDAVLPAARALAEMTGVEPDSVEGRLMKQRRRLYDEQTAQVAVEVLAFRRAQEQMGLARLRTQFSNADSNQLFEIWRRHLAGEAVHSDGNPLPSHEAEASRSTARRATNASWITLVSSLPSTTIPSTRSPSTVPFAASSSLRTTSVHQPGGTRRLAQCTL